MAWTQKGQQNQGEDKRKPVLPVWFKPTVTAHLQVEPDISLYHVALLNGKQTGMSLQTTVRVLKFKEELKEVWF